MHALTWSRSDYLTLLSLHLGLQLQLPYTGTAYDWALHVAPLAITSITVEVFHLQGLNVTKLS